MTYYFLSLIFLLVLQHYKSCAQRIVWDNSVDFDAAMEQFDLRDGSDVRMPNWMFIYPGTKWCGAGNIADNYDDLGKFSDTDMCCRAHDNCDDIIEGHESKHNLTNDSFYTRLNCRCDFDFHKCLKQVDSYVSSQVGHLYFTTLSTQCYRKEYPIVNCSKYTYFPTRKCKIYQVDNTKEMFYQWFDLPNY